MKTMVESEHRKEAGTTRRKGNRTRILVFSTRGIVPRFRHLMGDLLKLLPHGKKEPKLDTKSRLTEAVEVCELRNCNMCMLFDTRKRQDLYMWLAVIPGGPSVKFQCLNVHTMAELKFPGNCLMYSRPLVVFDGDFESKPEWLLMKNMLSQAFISPREHRKTKPFVDHLFLFSRLDDKIWFRCYQVAEDDENLAKEAKRFRHAAIDSVLVEIGPRFVLDPIRIFSGAFGGSTLYESPNYVSPNVIRRALRKRKSGHYEDRVISKKRREERKEDAILPPDPLKNVFK